MTVLQAITLTVLTLLLSNIAVQSFQPSSTSCGWTRNTRGSGSTATSTYTTTSSTELSLAVRRPFISGNWKLNPQTRDEAIQLATDIAASVSEASPTADIALFVPYVFIESTMNVVQSKLMIGAEVS
jgi:Triosephosphate isomerase